MHQSWEDDEDESLFGTSVEGEALSVGVHGEWVVVGIRLGERGAMIHVPPAVARDAALNLLRSADASESIESN